MMTVLAILLQGFGFYSFYSSSAKVAWREGWLAPRRAVARAIGAASLLISFVLLGRQSGVGAGILSGSVILMTIANLVVLFAPLAVKKR